MPYISAKKRTKHSVLPPKKLAGPGELNYYLTKLICQYLGANPDYKKYNDAIGAIECCKLEIYRRLIAVYENYKSVDNGDIPEFEKILDNITK